MTLRTVELPILLSVGDRPRHGYAILQDGEERSGGEPVFEIPTFYRASRRLRAAGLIRAADGEPDVDERRQHWEATKLGRQVLAAQLKRLEVVLAVGRGRTRQARAGGKQW